MTITMKDGVHVDMWGKQSFEPRKYRADASFYPHGSFGYCYRGNIYDEDGSTIGDYAANDNVSIEANFFIEWI